MLNRFSRTELLLGTESIEKLASSHVAVFGIGGVGGYTAEALARSGVGSIDLIDNDTISITNINRQIYALTSTLGKYKVDAAKDRILDINPDIKIRTHKLFFTHDTEFDFSCYDYVVDAIDTVSGKIAIVEKAKAAGVPVISCMGAGNKMNPQMFEVEDIYKTSVCPLARVIRQELKKRSIKSLKVVYSKESPIKPGRSTESVPGKNIIPGSNAFTPPVAGLITAGEVIKDLIQK